MSQQGVLNSSGGGGTGNIMTLSSEGGPHTPPVANNYNFSGSVAGGSANNGAIEFITPGGPGAATDGQMDAVVRTDNVTIHINASNNLEVVGGVFGETITGDTGGALHPTAGNWNIIADQAALNSGSSVLFSGATSTLTLNVTDSFNNTIIGRNAGSLTNDGHNFGNTGVGLAVLANLDPTGAGGNNNTAFGFQSLSSVVSGISNCAYGINSADNWDGNDVCSFGAFSLGSATSGNDNSVFGFSGFGLLVTGNTNCGFGSNVGSNYVGAESNNILIMNAGVAAESNVMRLGTQGAGTGQVNTCFIAGINGNTVSNEQFVTIDSVSGQLGTRTGSGVGETITGDTGGAISPTAGNWNIETNRASNNSGASVFFAGSGSTLTLNVTDSSNDTFVGNTCGNTTLSGNSNIGLGSNVLSALTTGSNDVAVGRNNLNSCTTGNNNSAFGAGAVLAHLVSGSSNTALGVSAGINYTGSESSNIVISNGGVAAESNVIRLGTQGSGLGQQNTCFIAGITGVTVSNQEFVTINTSTGQLGTSSAGFATTYTNVTSGMSPYTVLPADQYISCDTSGGAITLNFPNAPTANREWVVKDRTGNSAANNITVTTPGGVVTIDGSTTYLLNTAYMAINLLANSTPTYEVF